MEGFAGLDLTSSDKKPSAYAFLGPQLEIVRLDFLVADGEIISAIERDRPLLTGIDAPLSLPRGLCCLEESCPCQPASSRKGRACERELARLGMPCYFTTKRSIIQQMVYRALHLKKDLVARGHGIVEVYPYATRLRLFGNLPRKASRAGIQELRKRLVSLLPALTNYPGELNHDLCDALLAAYTVYLKYHGKTQLVGDPEEGAIAVPASS